MNHIALEAANSALFAAYHAIYNGLDRMVSFDWNECIRNLHTRSDCYFLTMDHIRIGGVTISEGVIQHAFIIPPFSDRAAFWSCILAHMKTSGQTGRLQCNQLSQEDTDALIRNGATLKWTQQRMLRPTDTMEVIPHPAHELSTPCKGDIQEIIQVVYNAHVNDYTAKTYGPPQISDVTDAIQRRFDAFTQTNTLHMSVIAREKETRHIIGVCIAGIYPDSPNQFSTIHQVSVLPSHRRQGVARAMMSQTIHTAHTLSPVITLGVLTHNPAAHLYRNLGFIAGPRYSDLEIMLGVES